VGQQIAQGFSDLSVQVVDGIGEIREWLREGPLQASDSQISDFLTEAQQAVVSSNEQVVTRVREVGTALTHILAGDGAFAVRTARLPLISSPAGSPQTA